MGGVSREEVIRRIGFENAWWALDPDQPLRFKQPAKRDRFQALVDNVLACPMGVAYMLVGPRRVGKTVMLRQLIIQLILDGVGPKNILYVNLSNPILWHLRVSDLLDFFRDHLGHSKDAALHVILDDIQYLRDWKEGLWRCAEANPQIKFIAAASAGVPLHGERMAGEWPYPAMMLPPLSFAEFLKIRGSEEKIFGNEGHELRSSQMPLLNEEFVRYVNFGGFPEGLMTRTEGSPPPTFVRDSLIDRMLHKDLASLHGINDPWDLNRLAVIMIQRTGAEMGIEDLSRETGIAKNTVRKYLEFLEAAYLIHRVDRINDSARYYHRAVYFKAHVTSTSLYAALFGPTNADHPAFARLAETALFNQMLGSPAIGQIAYAGWRGGKVDLVAMDERLRTPWLVAEMDWNESVVTSVQGPRSLGMFVANNCPEATVFLMTRSIARPATIKGLPVQIVPTALACYITRSDLLTGLQQRFRRRLIEE